MACLRVIIDIKTSSDVRKMFEIISPYNRGTDRIHVSLYIMYMSLLCKWCLSPEIYNYIIQNVQQFVLTETKAASIIINSCNINKSSVAERQKTLHINKIIVLP